MSTVAERITDALGSVTGLPAETDGWHGRSGALEIVVQHGRRRDAIATAATSTRSGRRIRTSRYPSGTSVDAMAEALRDAQDAIRRVAATADRLEGEGWNVAPVPWYVGAGGVSASSGDTTVTLYGSGIAESRDPAARLYAQTVYDGS